MCVVSVIMDHYYDEWNKKKMVPWENPNRTPPVYPGPSPYITPEEINGFRILLERARKYDQEHNQPDCELESKRKKLLDLAKELGVEIAFL